MAFAVDPDSSHKKALITVGEAKSDLVTYCASCRGNLAGQIVRRVTRCVVAGNASLLLKLALIATVPLVAGSNSCNNVLNQLLKC
jgi:hypothetical protein